MTVAAPKTKAEQALSQSFEAVASRLPGGAAVAEARKKAIGVFSALGLPHRRIEQWKYTDIRERFREALPAALPADHKISFDTIRSLLGPGLSALDANMAVFVNGSFSFMQRRLEDHAGCRLEPLNEMLEQGPDELLAAALAKASDESVRAMLGLNTAYMTDGAVIRISEGIALDDPVHLVFITQGDAGEAVTTRNIIDVGRGARLTIIESHVGSKPKLQANAVSQIVVREGGRLAHVKVLAEGAGAQHVGHWQVELAAGAVYRGFQFTAGTGLVRNGVFALIGGEGARLDISGAFLGRGAEHIDTTLLVDHAVPGGESRELFKGVLADRARGVFQGKVIVRPDAQKTDGKQMAQALLLSPEAEFDSKPELEIFADDVVCGHGSTAAEIDEDLLFYMLSRGIPRAQARALLIESFLGEAFDKVEDGRLREALFEMAKHRLAALSSAGRGGGST